MSSMATHGVHGDRHWGGREKRERMANPAILAVLVLWFCGQLPFWTRKENRWEYQCFKFRPCHSGCHFGVSGLPPSKNPPGSSVGAVHGMDRQNQDCRICDFLPFSLPLQRVNFLKRERERERLSPSFCQRKGNPWLDAGPTFLQLGCMGGIGRPQPSMTSVYFAHRDEREVVGCHHVSGP